MNQEKYIGMDGPTAVLPSRLTTAASTALSAEN